MREDPRPPLSLPRLPGHLLVPAEHPAPLSQPAGVHTGVRCTAVGAGLSLRCLGHILGRSVATVRRYVRAWQDRAPLLLSHLVTWTLETKPGFPVHPIEQPQGIRPGREHIVELSVWARRVEVMLVPQDEPHKSPGWAAVNLLLQGSPHWL